jgi:hypothetical protein
MENRRVLGTDDAGYYRVLVRYPTGGLNTAETWFISKREAHVENGVLVADTQRARQFLGTLPRPPRKVRGNLFRAAFRKPREF